MMEFREGLTEAMADMLLTVPGWRKLLPPDYRDRLNRMTWCVGTYEGDECTAAMWGSPKTNYLNIACNPKWKGRFMTRRLLRQFFEFYFSRYNVARAEAKEYAHLWKRLGFKEKNGVLEATWAELRVL